MTTSRARTSHVRRAQEQEHCRLPQARRLPALVRLCTAFAGAEQVVRPLPVGVREGGGVDGRGREAARYGRGGECLRRARGVCGRLGGGRQENERSAGRRNLDRAGVGSLVAGDGLDDLSAS